MITISLCMIVKNEEDVLERCLSSVQGVADEIIIADTGSTDRTKEIARTFTEHVYDFVWVDDFAAARNFSFSKAAMDYCMWLDADDVLMPAHREALLDLKARLNSSVDVVMLPYHTAFDEDGAPTFTYYRERLLRRSSGFRWAGAVHEAISPAGEVLYCDEAAVTHQKTRPSDPDRNLHIYEVQREAGRPFSPRDQFYYARELTYHGRDEEAAAQLEFFLDGGLGWVENNLEACRLLAQCLKRLNRPPEHSLRALLRALTYGPPRPELCCDIGAWFFERRDWRSAVFWYELALSRPEESANGGFVQPDCRGYIPWLQLCVCWYRLGDPAKAEACNEQAGVCKPHGAAFLSNREFFRKPGA